MGLMGIVSRESRTLHLFDSFEGLPMEEDGRLMVSGACRGENVPTVREFLVNHLSISEHRLVFHVGWFQDTVPADAPDIEQISILRLDGDLYKSTRVCLNMLYDKLSPGGFLIIDDYGAFEDCRRAVDEFFGNRGEMPSFIHSDKECVYFRKGE